MSRPIPAVVALLLVAALAPAAIGGVAAADVTIELKVVDSGGSPVGGADLTVSWEGGEATKTTTADGRALFDVPENASVEVSVDHDTYLRNHPFEIENATGTVYEVPVSLSGTLSITVRGQTGPVQGATVSLIQDGRYAASTETASDGTATTDPVERGTYGLRVIKPGYYRNVTTIDIGGPTELTRQIRPGAVQLRFNVTDDHFSPPHAVENATVRIDQLTTTLRTFEDGGVSVSVPVNRGYDVTITKSGYGEVSRQIDIAEQGRVIAATIQRTPEITLRSANRQIVVGETTRVTVTNAYDEPVQGATISVGDTEVGTTNTQGILDVPIDSEGNATISATFEGLSDSVRVEGVSAVQPTTTTAPPTTTTTTTGGGGPGFGVVLALLALLAAAAIAGRGRNR